jgi:hypothetical protein
MIKTAMKITDASSGGPADVVAYQGDIWLVDDVHKHSSLPASLQALLPKDPYTAPENWDADEILEQRPDIFVAHWDPAKRSLWSGRPASVGHFPGSSLLVKRVAEALGARDLGRSTSWGEEEDRETTFVRPEMTGQLPKVMYHGTSSLYAPSIMRRGLAPGESPTNYPRVVDHPNTLFLSADIAEAAMHADHTTARLEDRRDWERKPRKYGGYGVVFGVAIPDPAKLLPDYDVDVSSSQSQWERPSGLWGEPIPSPSPNQSTRLSRDFGMIGYEGRIPASFIREVWVKDGERFLDFTEMTPSEFQFFLQNGMTEEEYVEHEQLMAEEEEEFGSVARTRLVPLSKRAQGDYRRAWTILKLVK